MDEAAQVGRAEGARVEAGAAVGGAEGQVLLLVRARERGGRRVRDRQQPAPPPDVRGGGAGSSTPAGDGPVREVLATVHASVARRMWSHEISPHTPGRWSLAVRGHPAGLARATGPLGVFTSAIIVAKLAWLFWRFLGQQHTWIKLDGFLICAPGEHLCTAVCVSCHSLSLHSSGRSKRLRSGLCNLRKVPTNHLWMVKMKGLLLM